ncbi:MAG: trehalose-6-phosphate synthase [Planctomycetota bacterium]
MAKKTPKSSAARGKRRLVIVANRMPVRKVKGGARGGSGWETSPGGLVSALAPMLQRSGGAWVGWDGTTSRSAREPFLHDGINIRPVPLTKDELDRFYAGFSNKTLWPLYHDAIRAPAFHRHWWWPYVKVNERYAEATCEVAGDDDVIWVQDYQLQLAPSMIRDKRPNARIGFFLHIPFPPEELFAKLPWRKQTLEGLLGADVLGFQTKLSAQNFSRAARRYTSATGSDTLLNYQGRQIVVDAFPISIQVSQFQDLARDPEVIREAERFRGSWDQRKIILCVDRLDYTKGIDIRLRAFEEVLRRGNFTADECVMIQVAVPTRQSVDDYAELRETVEQYVGRINGTYAKMEHIAVHYVHRSLPMRELLAAYLAADVMMVTPLRDGMNLVAKEYCATRLEGSGVLVLSEFAGAALELKQALLVNPYDIDGMATTLEDALRLDDAEARRRMNALRRTIEKHDVSAWSDSFLRRLDADFNGSATR